MNKHTLNYHTRLHDWYRQHSIQVEKQQQHQHSVQETGGGGGGGGGGHHAVHASTHSLAVVAPGCSVDQATAAAASNLTQDKLYFISQWCSEVNKTLFRVKRKESPPLYRRCRLGTASSKDLTASGVRVAGGKTSAVADPRRVRSAEVFTLAGHWAKQPKPTLTGGELLPHASQTKAAGGENNKRDGVTVSGGPAAGSSAVELCVRNSKDAETQQEPAMARINHDSLSVRSNAFILRQQYNHGRVTGPAAPGGALSPRSSAAPLERDPRVILHNKTQASARRRAKSAAVHRNARRQRLDEEDEEEEDEEEEDEEGRGGEWKQNGEAVRASSGVSRSHKELERLNNAKNEAESRSQGSLRQVSSGQKSRVTSSKTRASTLSGPCEEGEDGNSTLVRRIINVVVRDESAQPGANLPLCNGCSQDIANRDLQEEKAKPDKANAVRDIIHEEFERAKRIAEHEKCMDQEIQKADVDVKHVTNRLTEDSLHYSSEREALRQSNAGKSFAIPNTFDDLEDERNLSFEDVNENVEDDKLSNEAVSDADQSDVGSNNSNDMLQPENTRVRRKSAVTIKIEAVDDDDDNGDEAAKTADENVEASQPVASKDRSLSASDSGTMEPPDADMLKLIESRRGSRRKSIGFSIKPTVGNLSTSNSLLHVLSIDDCKMSMRYSPHRVLEEHEVTDSLMLPLSQLITADYFHSSTEDSAREDDNNNKGGNNNNNKSRGGSGSKGAMRVSGQDSGVTTLRTASAHHATRANKKQYRSLNDPDDPAYYKHLRPQSASLAKAFNTLINDRTVMQRLDRPGTALPVNRRPGTGSSVNVHHPTESFVSDKAGSSKGVKKPYEGPVYQRANTALRRHMDAMIQRHSHQLKARYERLKSGGGSASLKRKTTGVRGNLDSYESSDKSLSLESLPQVRKGILKASHESLIKTSYESLHK